VKRGAAVEAVVVAIAIEAGIRVIDNIDRAIKRRRKRRKREQALRDRGTEE
jgi:hypothetical protein